MRSFASREDVGASLSVKQRALRALAHGIVLLGLTWSVPAQSAEQWASGLVRTVYTGADGFVVVTLMTDPPQCTSPANPKYLHAVAGSNGVNTVGARQIFALAMLAFASGKYVDIAFDDSTSACLINRIIVR
jgi:hypothetical protein